MTEETNAGASANSIKSLFKWGGIVLLFFSAFYLFTLITEGMTPTRLLDFGMNFIIGIFWLYFYRLVIQRNALVVWLYSALALISMTRSVFLGNFINMIIVIGVNLYIWFGLYNLKKKGELS